MSLFVGILLACAAGLAGTLLCPDDKAGRSRLPLLAALLAGGLSWHAPARAGEILRGPAQVIDGGTLRVGTRAVSLFGIAAPEADATCADAQDRPYPCGRDAARALAERIGGDHPELRARLVAAQFAGLINACWLVGDPVLAGADHDAVVAFYGDAIQRLLTCEGPGA